MQEDAGARETPEAVGDVLAAFREIVDTAVTPTWLLSPDSSMLHANGPLHDWCGASARELQGVGWLTRLHPEDAAHSSAYWQRLFADGQSTEIYFRLRRMDGSYAGLCANCIPLRDGSGAWLVTTRLESPASGTAAVLTRLDPNANGHALRALFFEHMLEPAFIWELSEKRPIIDWNRGAEQTFGFESQEAIGRDARELLQTRACTRWSEIEASLKREGSWQGELLQRHRLGDTLAIETRLQLVLCAGRPPLVLESGIDNSALRQGERAVIEGQARLRLALSSARIGIWEWRLESDRLVWSSEAKTVLGSPPEEFAPTLPALIARVHPDDRASVRERLEDAVAHVRDVELEFRCPRHDHVRWLRCRGIVERDEGGRATRVVGTISDVTPERLQEASLRESEQRARARADELSALMDALPAAVWIAHDRHAKQVTGSRVGHEILRMPWGANLSKTAEDTAPVQHFTVLKDGLELQPDELPLQVAALTGKEIRDFEEEIRFGDGSSIYLYGSAVPLLDEKREPRGAIAAFIDVTRIKHAESEQRAAARRKDEFLAILSHELRNPLAPILTAVHLMKLRGDVPAPNERDVIERQAKHLVRLVNDLLD
ncbi:MAG TPA: PAS domain-containing protein, partial [Polyangiaceae bacterium]|nr:PAS domain-containing protein [Polyangiaceae bacterium]